MNPAVHSELMDLRAQVARLEGGGHMDEELLEQLVRLRELAAQMEQEIRQDVPPSYVT